MTLHLCDLVLLGGQKKAAVKETAATWELLIKALLSVVAFHKLVIFIAFILTIAAVIPVIKQGAQIVGKGF